MTDQFSESPQLPAADMERLAAEVKMHQENPEHRLISGHQLVKRSLETIHEKAAPVPAAAPAAPAGNDDDALLPSYAQNAPAPTKIEIEHLLGVAFREGILKASAEAAGSSPFVLDAFHDALAGKLYPELQKRGIVH
jgi:hypothetical protein